MVKSTKKPAVNQWQYLLLSGIYKQLKHPKTPFQTFAKKV